MNMVEAFADLIHLARERNYDTIGFEQHGVDFEHLESMLNRIQANPTGFSSAKLGRWLGYAQGVMVATGTFTLDEMKDLNRLHAD